MYSFFSKTIKEWNSLPTSAITSNTLSSLASQTSFLVQVVIACSISAYAKKESGTVCIGHLFLTSTGDYTLSTFQAQLDSTLFDC